MTEVIPKISEEPVSLPAKKRIQKWNKARGIRATFFPLSGEPSEFDSVITDNGMIEFEGMEWNVVSGSVWSDGKRRRTICPEGLPTTVSATQLSAPCPMTARTFFFFMKNNMLEQLFRLQNQKPWFKQGSTWIIAGALLLVSLILVWNVVSMGNGLESVSDTLKGIHLPPVSPSPTPSSGTTVTPGG